MEIRYKDPVDPDRARYSAPVKGWAQELQGQFGSDSVRKAFLRTLWLLSHAHLTGYSDITTQVDEQVELLEEQPVFSDVFQQLTTLGFLKSEDGKIRVADEGFARTVMQILVL